MSIEDAGNYNIYDTDPGIAGLDDEDYSYDPEELDERPSDLTIRGTSTTNPASPRTVAAGYDRKTQVLTVVFRDGTWWNYYDVPEYMWAEFSAAESKGKYLRESGLDTWDKMGRANLSHMAPTRRAKLNNIVMKSRRHQEKTGGQVLGSSRSMGMSDGFEASRGD